MPSESALSIADPQKDLEIVANHDHGRGDFREASPC